MMFHITSIIYIPLYYILHRHINKKFAFIVVGLANLFYFIGSDLMITVFYWFISNFGYAGLESYLYFFIDTSDYKFSFGFFERTFLILLVIMYSERIREKVPCGNIFFNLSLLYYVFFLLLSPVDVLADRVPLLFILTYWIIPPVLMTFKHKFRTIIAGILLPLCLGKLVLSTQDNVARYDNLLVGISSFEERRIDVLEHNRSND